jgi:hypothetical protein
MMNDNSNDRFRQEYQKSILLRKLCIDMRAKQTLIVVKGNYLGQAIIGIDTLEGNLKSSLKKLFNDLFPDSSLLKSSDIQLVKDIIQESFNIQTYD